MFVTYLVEVDQELYLQCVQTGRLTGCNIHTDKPFVKRPFSYIYIEIDDLFVVNLAEIPNIFSPTLSTGI